MTSIARDMPTARRILKKALFPIEPEEPAPDAKLNIKYELNFSLLFPLLLMSYFLLNPFGIFHIMLLIYQ